MPRRQDMDDFALSATRRTLPMALLRAREALMDHFRPILHANDVTEQQWRVMRVLQEIDELDAGDLAVAASILAPSLSRILKTLETKGFITTRKDPEDGRRALIRLTEDGDRFLRKIAPLSAAIYEDVEARFGKDRIDALLSELEALEALMSAPAEQGLHPDHKP